MYKPDFRNNNNFLVPLGVVTSLGLLAGCGAAKQAAREAANPGARQATSQALKLGGQATHNYGIFRTGVEQAATVVDDTRTLRITKSVDGVQYTEEVSHSPSALDDGVITQEEMDRIECSVKVGYQVPGAVNEVKDGTSILTRGLDGEWLQTISSNYSGGPIDPCELVLSALPGASNN